MGPLRTVLLLTGNLALKDINACTEQLHLLSKLTPSECRVRPLLDIECSPQQQAKSSLFFFFSCRVWVLSWRGFFPFILSSIFKHWFGGDFKWERNGASARYLEGNCYPQHKHSHPQTIAQNPNNWLGSPKELDGVKSHLSLWAPRCSIERTDAGQAFLTLWLCSYFAFSNGFLLVSFFFLWSYSYQRRREKTTNTKWEILNWFRWWVSK